MTRQEQQRFIDEVAKYVKKYAPKYNISCYSAPIAQFCLESKYGTSELAVNAHNYSGLKYKSNVSEGPGYYKIGSEQKADGSYVSSQMKWCNFSSMEKGIEGYFKFINQPRYANLKNVTDPAEYLEKIKLDGYATSLKYIENNYNVIKEWGLTKFDPKAKYFRVQCGESRNRQFIESLQKKVEAKGFQAIVKDFGGVYKLQIGAYTNQQTAAAKVTALRQAGFNAVVVYD